MSKYTFNHLLKEFSILILLVILFSTYNFGRVLPVHLRCEYLKDPLGIDVVHPRLSWILHEDDNSVRGQKQSAYQIIVSSSLKKLEDNNGDLWNSGKINSRRTNQVVYEGKKLKSQMYCYWKVRVWDKNEVRSNWSHSSYWTMGLLGKNDWKAKWIGAPAKHLFMTTDPPIPPSPLLRKEFDVTKKIKHAFIYVTARGDYELRLNGRKVGNHLLAPGWTDYLKRIQYQTYDVTKYLNHGENTIGAILADGWYAGRTGMIRFYKQYPRRGGYGVNRRLILQMEIEYSDGTKKTVLSDSTWKINPDGPIRSADNFLGETYDARKEKPGWDKPGYNDSKWKNVTIGCKTKARLVAQMNPAITEIDSLRPISITEPSPGNYIFDMGQNMVGWCKLRANIANGDTVKLRHGEMLKADGSLYTANLGTAKQTDIFIGNGKGMKTFEPHFTYHGFRYVEVSGLKSKPNKTMLTGIVISSGNQPNGYFQCSNQLINKIMSNVKWTQRGNLMSVPTDCPQRDERMGWTGDAQVFSQTAIFNSNMAPFYTKWTKDLRDDQNSDGRFPDIAPRPLDTYINNLYGSPGWADAGVIIPWRIYQNYGDVRILKKNYSAIKRYIDYINKHNPNHLWVKNAGSAYGDWLNGDNIDVKNYPRTGAAVSQPFFATAYFEYTTRLLSKMASVLGKRKDAEKYFSLADKIKHTFEEKFINPDGTIGDNAQASYAMALGFNLVPDKLQKIAVKKMLLALYKYDMRLSTGFHSTIMLLKDLSRFDLSNGAYSLIESTRFPSWGYEIKQGATTIWERWDGYVKGRGFQNSGMNSFNHYAFGSVGEWIYRTILGINPDDANPGYKHIILKPVPGGGLTWAKGEYKSVNGNIIINWKIKNKQLNLNVVVPVNTSATITIPSSAPSQITEGNVAVSKSKGIQIVKTEKNYSVYNLTSGHYSFKVPYNQKNIFGEFKNSLFELPEISPKQSIIDNSKIVKVTISTKIHDATIRYTLDGSVPDENSQLYSKPFIINKNTTIKAVVFKNGRRSILPAQHTYYIVNPNLAGLNYKYYEGPLKKLPNFDTLDAKLKGHVYQINLDRIKTRQNHFAINYWGYIHIPVSGNYTFYTNSDDGSKVYIDNKLVVDNGGSHGLRERSGKIRLSKGKHKINVQYFQDYAGKRLEVSIKGPDKIKHIIPVTMLTQK